MGWGDGVGGIGCLFATAPVVLELAFSLRIAVGILGRIIYVLRVVDHAASQQQNNSAKSKMKTRINQYYHNCACTRITTFTVSSVYLC